ncbi:MAG: hypothetical protein ABMA00_22880 [Gemmatimonas sp.]
MSSDTATAPAVDAMPAGFGDAFIAVDARARAALFQMQCSSTVLRLRASGTFGTASSAPRNVYCERNADGVPLGGVFDVDTGYARARRLIMIRLDGSRPRYVSPIDTARVAQGARLVRDVTREVSPAWRRLARPFTVVALPQDDGSMEGWVIPLSPRSGREVLGGDIAVIRAANGRLQRTIDRAASWKLVVVPPTGAVRLTSAEHDIASVGDLVVARSLAERGRAVTVTTAKALSALVPGIDASGSRYRWEHTPAKP